MGLAETPMVPVIEEWLTVQSCTVGVLDCGL
jgi:hypothetical protein